jgi:hypothetical protein
MKFHALNMFIWLFSVLEPWISVGLYYHQRSCKVFSIYLEDITSQYPNYTTSYNAYPNIIQNFQDSQHTMDPTGYQAKMILEFATRMRAKRLKRYDLVPVWYGRTITSHGPVYRASNPDSLESDFETRGKTVVPRVLSIKAMRYEQEDETESMDENEEDEQGEAVSTRSTR